MPLVPARAARAEFGGRGVCKRCLDRDNGRSSIYADGEDYSADEVEFLKAMQGYMKRTGRKFPSFTEVLAVAKSLGYTKVPA